MEKERSARKRRGYQEKEKKREPAPISIEDWIVG